MESQSENINARSEGIENSTWGSLHDSELNLALKEQSSKQSINEEICTDIDTDVDDNFSKNLDNFTSPTKVRKSSNNRLGTSSKHSISEDWGSMNDSQFISFVNKLSQSNISLAPEEGNNNFTEIPDVSVAEVDKTIPIQHSTPSRNPGVISSSPVMFAQKFPYTSENDDDIKDQLSNLSQEDVMTREDYEDSDKYAFEDYEGYFKAKTAKQHKQGEEYSNFLKKNDDSNVTYLPLFKNCAIHVNGRTDPDILQLRKLIVLYGGKYVHYLSSKGAATHIIAESLPPRKRIQFGNCKVVTPKWIVDSIENKRLLNWADYRLDQLGDYGQQIINFATKLDPKVKEKNDVVKDLEFIEDLVDNDDHDVTNVEQKKDHTDNTVQVPRRKESSNNNEVEIVTRKMIDSGINAKHPDFLKIFFSKSRLHHLSTWKSDLRSEFLNKAIMVLKERKTDDFHKSSFADRVILHVDFDCFFATVSAKLQNPPIDVLKVPCCVTHGGASADIASCNYVARKYGVRNGMWFSNAQKLCSDIVSMPYQFDEYERISKIFYNELLSLNIDSILPVSIDEALIDITSIYTENPEGIENSIKNIKNTLDLKTGCSVSCGAGKNVLLAKLSLKKAKPNGTHTIIGDDATVLKFLDDINVKSLPGFGDKMFEKLISHFGNWKEEEFTLKNLRDISESKLKSVFGVKLGTTLFEYARGIDPTSIDVLSDPDKYLRKSLSIDVNWGIRFDDDIQVETFLHQLATELSKRLVNIEMLGSTITLKLSVRHPNAPIEPAKYLGMGYCNFVSKSAKLGINTNTISVLSSEMKYLWRFLNIEPKELRGVGVSMNKLVSTAFAKVDIDSQMKLQFKTALKKQIREPEEVLALNKDLCLESKHSILSLGKGDSPSKTKIQEDPYIGEIDWEVFDKLPTDLQREIKDELRRRKLQSSPKKRKAFANNKDIAHLLSPQKKTPAHSDIGENVFLITPQKVAKHKTKELIFQGIPASNEESLIEKLIIWIDFTIDEKNGIYDKDLELFKDFMIKLLSVKDLLRYKRILSALSVYLESKRKCLGYTRWKNELDHFNYLLDEQSYYEFQFKF